jgi:hypothetical protein
MPRNNSQPDPPLDNTGTEVAALLARAILRLRKQAQSGRFGHENPPTTGLEQCSETSVSVARTRGLRLRDVGDQP